MAFLKSASRILNRPQIKTAKQPVPRQVILPQKTQPFVNPAQITRNQTPVLKNIAQPKAIQQTKSQGIPQSDMQSLLARLQSQFTNSTNPLYSPSQIDTPTQAPVGFESYGFDKGLVDYLNNQRLMSATDAGISYNYDPATQTFKGQAMGGPVTKTLAEIQAESQNYANRPAFNPNNPAVAAQAGVMQNPPMPVQGGFGQPQVPYQPNQPNYQNTQPFNGIQQMQGQLGMQPQQGFNAMPNYNQQGLGSMGQSPYQTSPMIGGNMATPYNSGMPMGGFGSTQPFNQAMPQTGFVPMGGYDPQNTSNGSFGTIQQPTGGFGNIGSLLGMG